MKKFFLILISTLSITAAFAQDQAGQDNRPTKADRKQAKREKINQMIRLEEEGEPAYRKYNAFGIKLNFDGYGLSYEWGKMKTPYRASFWQAELNEKKHPKEQKQSTGDNIGSGFIVLGNPFVYGKQNNFYQLKGSFGRQILIGGKGNKNGVGVYGIVAGGLSLGLLRPYYIEVESPSNSGQYKTIKYSQADSADFLGYDIVGGTGITTGWSELKLKPGVHAKTAIRFDWGRFNNNISALEFGFNFEYYPQKIEQMATIAGKNFFVNGYLSLLFGRRK